MPDLRGHGDSDKPHNPACYKPDVLADDAFDLIGHLGLTDYDLAGYSLGGRTSVRMLAKGAKPRRAVLSGMGLDGLLDTQGRGGYFRHVDRKRVVQGKGVSVRVELGGRGLIKN